MRSFAAVLVSLALASGLAPAREDAELRKTVEVLRVRISSLEAERARNGRAEYQLAHQVVAPFEVVDKSGNAIFLVTDEPNDSTKPRGRIRVGPSSAGNYVIGIRGPSGGFAAAIGDSKVGGGGLVLYDAAGRNSVQLHGGGGFTLFSPSQKEVATIGLQLPNTERSILRLSGTINILDRAGHTVVEAGASDKAEGVVRVGLNPTCLPKAGLIVPDCIRGHVQ
jgi:hypothetical protein